MSAVEPRLMRQVFACIDHTTLTSADSARTVDDFCRRAQRLVLDGDVRVAAVCVYPRFVAAAKRALEGSGIRVASVAGAFPHGQLPIELKKAEVEHVVASGADEVDIVINRGLLIEGDLEAARREVQAMRDVCRGRVLKVILETCDLPSPTLVRQAVRVAVEGGADFVKTSTGKGSAGATLEAAEIMLRAVREYRDSTGRTVGFKAAGGIRQPAEALAYARLASEIMGNEYIVPATFRIGASSLTERMVGL